MFNKIKIEKNDYELFVEQLIGDTEIDHVTWEIIATPSYLEDGENIRKVLRTALGDGNDFLMYTYDYQDYSSELDKWHTTSSINCCFVNNDVVIEYFGRAVSRNTLYKLERVASRSIFKFDIKKYLRKAE